MTIPLDFVQEVKEAAARNDRAYLELLSLEVESLVWAVAGNELIRKLLAHLPAPLNADRVVLFTGHRIDGPGRATPRFPPEMEPAAHAAIRAMLTREQEQGQVTGIAGGANGGDILFLESCRSLAIRFEMRLALPQHRFVSASVAAPDSDWVARFESLAANEKPRVLAETEKLPDWLSAKKGYSFWQRNNLWLIASALALAPRHFTLSALWDGQAGDGDGGTEDMVNVAQQHGAEFVHLDTRRLFDIAATRSGAQ